MMLVKMVGDHLLLAKGIPLVAGEAMNRLVELLRVRVGEKKSCLSVCPVPRMQTQPLTHPPPLVCGDKVLSC